MSDYHILEADAYGNALQIVMHFPVPVGDNAVGVVWQAVQAALWGSSMSIVLTIDPAEQAQLDAGELYEHSYMFNSRPGESLADKRDVLDAAYLSESARVLPELARRLDFWGYARDVPSESMAITAKSGGKKSWLTKFFKSKART